MQHPPYSRVQQVLLVHHEHLRAATCSRHCYKTPLSLQHSVPQGMHRKSGKHA